MIKSFVIKATYKDLLLVEDVDSAPTFHEADELMDEYLLAYGYDWDLWIDAVYEIEIV